MYFFTHLFPVGTLGNLVQVVCKCIDAMHAGRGHQYLAVGEPTGGDKDPTLWVRGIASFSFLLKAIVAMRLYLLFSPRISSCPGPGPGPSAHVTMRDRSSAFFFLSCALLPGWRFSLVPCM
jgi:hypothetical protein